MDFQAARSRLYREEGNDVKITVVGSGGWGTALALVLEENGVSGIWLRREWSIFLITVEPFRIAYSEIEETKVKGMGTGSLFLKVRGQWKPVPVERGREVKERIDRRRAAG